VGIPALRISMAHAKNEADLMRDAGITAAEMPKLPAQGMLASTTRVEIAGYGDP